MAKKTCGTKRETMLVSVQSYCLFFQAKGAEKQTKKRRREATEALHETIMADLNQSTDARVCALSLHILVTHNTRSCICLSHG